MQCCTCSNWVHLKCSLLFFSRFRTLGSPPSWSCPPCFFWRSHTYQHCDFLVGLVQLVYLHCSIWPPVLMQHSHPTLAFKPLFLFSSTLYLLSLHPHHRLMLLTVSLYLLLPLPLLNSFRALQLNAGGLQARSTELQYFISSRPVDLICIQESNLNLFSSFRIPGFSALRSDEILCDSDSLLCDTLNLVFFLRMSQTLAAASSFSSGRAYPSVSFLPLLLAPTLIMWGQHLSKRLLLGLIS